MDFESLDPVRISLRASPRSVVLSLCGEPDPERVDTTTPGGEAPAAEVGAAGEALPSRDGVTRFGSV